MAPVRVVSRNNRNFEIPSPGVYSPAFCPVTDHEASGSSPSPVLSITFDIHPRKSKRPPAPYGVGGHVLFLLGPVG